MSSIIEVKMPEFLEKKVVNGDSVPYITELIEINKSLRESVVSIATILKEQSQSMTYPLRPEGSSDMQDRYRNRQSHCFGKVYNMSGSLSTDIESRRRRYQLHWQKSTPISSEAIETERMLRRSTYEGHWNSSIADQHVEKFSKLFPSQLPYDDPWWSFVPGTLKNPAPVLNASSLLQLDLSLQSDAKYDLFIALFGPEFSPQWCTSSRKIFEGSRRHRMADFIHKILATGAIRYFENNLIEVIIEVAEWTNKIWTFGSISSQTLQDLRIHCYEHRVLQEPNADEFHMAQHQNEGLLAIIYALDFRRWVDRGISWEYVAIELDLDDLPLESILIVVDEMINPAKDVKSRSSGLAPSKILTIRPNDLNVRTLHELGDITIVWTSELHLHLTLNQVSKELFVFEHPTWLFGRHFKKDQSLNHHVSIPDIRNELFHDLLRSYALLFGPVTSKEVRQYNRVQKNRSDDIYFLGHAAWRSQPEADNAQRINIELHPNVPPARDFLENFCNMRPSFGLALSIGLNPNKSTIGDLLRHSPYYPDDVIVMMLAIVRFSQNPAHSLHPEFQFAEQLRVLQAYMDGKKPRTFGQLWRDARDATSWYTFWAVLFFGVITILLALASLAVSIAQTVGTFMALDD